MQHHPDAGSHMPADADLGVCDNVLPGVEKEKSVILKGPVKNLGYEATNSELQ